MAAGGVRAGAGLDDESTGASGTPVVRRAAGGKVMARILGTVTRTLNLPLQNFSVPTASPAGGGIKKFSASRIFSLGKVGWRSL
jgi:hypothetical protein